MISVAQHLWDVARLTGVNFSMVLSARRGVWQRAGFVPIAATMARRGAYHVGKKIGNWMNSSSNSSSSNGGGERAAQSVPRALTFQHDSRLSYRRRKAPRRVRRRAAKAMKRFVRMDSKTLGLTSRVFPNMYAPAQIVPTGYADSQTVFTDGLYGGISGSATWGDLWAIANAEALATDSGMLNFRSARMDFQLRNASTTNVLVADVYTVVARKEGYNEPGEDWKQGLLNENTAAGTTAATPETLGVTPFDAPGFGQSWLVLSKTTYRISPGNSIYLELKGRKGLSFNTDRFEYDTTNTAYRTRMFRGLSKGLICVMRNADPIVGSPSKLGPIDYEIVSVKSYRYGIKAYAADAAGFS